MEDTTMVEEEDTKQFDSVHGGHDEDHQPDPQEELIMDSGDGRVWLVKIPRHLMEQWSSVDDEGVHLATIRVYPNAASASGKKPRIMLVLPPRPDDPSGVGEQFEMDMVNDDVENQIVVAEREKEPGTGSRARTTILTGRVKHECNLRPLLTDGYMRRVRQRSKMANQPKRQARLIDETVTRGNLNRLTSGAAPQSPFQLTRGKPKPAKGQFERMARMPRNQLLDELFRLFHDERERWSIKGLRERTQQPEAYLKEVLNDVAFLHRSGEFNGQWELMANFKEKGVKAEDVVPVPSGIKMEDVKMEDEEDEEEDDEDDDMEEVS
ncbi:transcription initiation factor IIF, beta subunit [Lentinus tigrinus ALCF2SS1-6]|uniref:Transcription initiation factor IIF subunit beta n=1 Tax=Lentinus tigrinus ALCF2SS1-6 TaxID=1328759 RepID=A0A5C2S772_9APHY|nr:transcription initiation factor IIF, beta subunit [Lentinus tigrinus ALCF2SS1-6]